MRRVEEKIITDDEFNHLSSQIVTSNNNLNLKSQFATLEKWYCFWSVQDEIAKQLATQIPWWYNVVISTKTKKPDEALFHSQKPIGVSGYIITKNLPDEFRSSLPSIEEIEAELSGVEESQ